MEISKELIHRFFENNCTPEEASRVYAYLQAHKDELEEWLPDQEWEAFEATRQLSADRSNRWFGHIEKAITNRSITARPLFRLAAAALIATAFAGVYKFMQVPVKKATPIAIVPQVPAINKEKQFRNTSNKVISYTLDDGSVVALHANSSIVCYQPFDSAQRNINLQGEALFRVAKDKSRPFTVFTKGFSTTALGTTFRIAAYDSSQTSTVQLIEGKVVLKNLQQTAKPIFLKPGDEFAFNLADNQFKRKEPQAPTPSKLIEPIQADGSITESTTEISFSNTPLPEVLNKISELYKISINADSINLEGRKFTGSFLKKQTADDILGTIAGLNNITVTNEGTLYRLINQ
ncbi:FecR family protein [Paraflavitalea soli]|uniref:FecR family protein n=1 Tax=Paraflavitalea soli TaxID=2315862 RepID=A0A3B7MUS0_9BACT|nr:FecR family protein [Paraflavitalea soli]AXY76756.1 FecR family protein [Paraflavitalea soli]